MINAWLESPDMNEMEVYCPICNEEAQINENFQIECSICEESFEIPEPDYDESDYEEEAYGY